MSKLPRAFHFSTEHLKAGLRARLFAFQCLYSRLHFREGKNGLAPAIPASQLGRRQYGASAVLISGFHKMNSVLSFTYNALKFPVSAP